MHRGDIPPKELVASVKRITTVILACLAVSIFCIYYIDSNACYLKQVRSLFSADVALNTYLGNNKIDG